MLRRGLTQVEVAALFGTPHPKVSEIRNYKLRGISLERLMQALTALGQRIEIVVSPASRAAPAPHQDCRLKRDPPCRASEPPSAILPS